MYCVKLLSEFNCKNIRKFSNSSKLCVNVSICGAGGGVGRNMAVLLKLDPLISRLNLYGIRNSPGISVDLNHINTRAETYSYETLEEIEEAIEDSDIVVITDGLTRKIGMSRRDLFGANANIVRDITTSVANVAPKAFICIITNPINSTVPVAAEVMKKKGVFDRNRLFGVTTLDVLRASTFVGEILKMDPSKIIVPVIGGHSERTIIPVYSQIKPSIELQKNDMTQLITKVQKGGSEIVSAKGGQGSATLSMAYAGTRFINSLCRALNGEENIVECAYVRSNITEAKYFANPVLIGTCGIKTNLGYGKLSLKEEELKNKAICEIIKDIEKGEKFMKKKPPNLCKTRIFNRS